MAQLVVAAAGAAVGFAIGGPQGAQIGWAVGSLVGSTFAPTQKSQGPRLGDLTVTGSAYGSVIPFVAGHPRVSGQIVWASNKREIASTQSSGGKGGGGGQQYTSYTYEIDLLILLASNEAQAISRVWQNGELVYNVLNTASDASVVASLTTANWSRITFYGGGSTQLPDPDYEAAVGTANAPAYRGRSTVFIKSLQLGSSGSVPNLTFEITTGATLQNQRYGEGILCHFDSESGSFYPSVIGPDFAKGTTSLNTSLKRFGAASVTAALVTPSTCSGPDFYHDNQRSWRAEGWFRATATSGRFFQISFGSAGSFTIGWDRTFADTAYYMNWGNSVNGGGGIFSGPLGASAQAGIWNHVAIQFNYETGDYKIYINGLNANGPGGVFPQQNPIAPAALLSASILGEGDEFYIRFIDQNGLFNDSYVVPSSPFTDTALSASIVTLTEPTVQTVVGALCSRAGLSAGQYDTTSLSTITRPVRSLAVSQAGNARSVLDILAACYFFEGSLSDKLYFTKRGTASVATIPYIDLGVDVGDSPGDPLPLSKTNDLEIPAQLALTYTNVSNDYQPDTQYSERLLGGQDNTGVTSAPLGFTPAEAKAIVVTQLTDIATAALTTSVSLGLAYNWIQPADVLTLIAKDGIGYAMRVANKTELSNHVVLDCVQDDASVLTQFGVTDNNASSSTTVSAIGNTSLALLDIPLLRDSDDWPGHYVAVSAQDTSWNNCTVFSSIDDVSYSTEVSIFDSTAIGRSAGTVPNWTGGYVFDETSLITVVLNYGELSSVTRDALLGNEGLNLCVIGSELIQFKTATLTAAFTYQLSGLLRGRQGTEWAQTGHAPKEVFALLGTPGMRFLQKPTSEIGRTKYLKAVTSGQRISAAVKSTITLQSVNLKPWAPVNARANRDAADTVLTWTRRTRYSTSFVGTAGSVVPLGETSERYDLEVYTSAAFTTVARTFSNLTSPTVTYTSAQQVTDFGAAQTVLYVRIYQRSEIVGRGYTLQATL